VRTHSLVDPDDERSPRPFVFALFDNSLTGHGRDHGIRTYKCAWRLGSLTRVYDYPADRHVRNQREFGFSRCHKSSLV